jgi:hypothetical protein
VSKTAFRENRVSRSGHTKIAKRVAQMRARGRMMARTKASTPMPR